MPSFRPPSTRRSARCRRASSGPQMARRGWRPKRGRMVSGRQHGREQRRPFAAGDRCAGRSRPRAGGRGRRPALRPPRPTTASRPRRCVSAAAMVASSRACGVAPACHQRRRGRPSRHRAGRSASRRRADRRHRRTWPSRHAARMRRHARVRASGRAGTCGRAAAPRRAMPARSRPSVHSGCFSKASRATGAKPPSTAATSARSRAAGGVSASGCAGRIVDLDVPAPQLGRDAARQIAVGRDQGGGAAVVLQRLAQRQRDDQRLLVRRRAIGARHMLERRRRRPRPRPRWSRPAASAR